MKTKASSDTSCASDGCRCSHRASGVSRTPEKASVPRQPFGCPPTVGSPRGREAAFTAAEAAVAFTAAACTAAACTEAEVGVASAEERSVLPAPPSLAPVADAPPTDGSAPIGLPTGSSGHWWHESLQVECMNVGFLVHSPPKAQLPPGEAQVQVEVNAQVHAQVHAQAQAHARARARAHAHAPVPVTARPRARAPSHAERAPEAARMRVAAALGARLHAPLEGLAVALPFGHDRLAVLPRVGTRRVGSVRLVGRAGEVLGPRAPAAIEVAEGVVERVDGLGAEGLPAARPRGYPEEELRARVDVKVRVVVPASSWRARGELGRRRQDARLAGGTA